MAYTEQPARADHDVPTAAMLQSYADNCDALLALVPPLGNSCDSHNGVVGASNVVAVQTHYSQYLYYESSSDKVSAVLYPFRRNTAIGDSISLPSAQTGGIYDLSSIAWLLQGMTYQIEDVHYAFEVAEF